MRVLVVAHNYPRFPGDPAGAFVARIAGGVAAQGHEVRVVAPHSPGTGAEPADSGVAVTRFRYAPDRFEQLVYTGAAHRGLVAAPWKAVLLPAFWFTFRSAVRRVAAEFAPDVVHAHWWLPSGRLVSNLGIPYVVTCHGTDVRLLDYWPVLRKVCRQVLKQASAVTAVSRFLANELTDFTGTTDVQVIRMPLDVALFSRGTGITKASPARILYVGNLVPEKGVDMLIGAFAVLKQKSIDCRLRIIGDGPSRPALVQQANRLGVGQSVDWLGPVPQTQMPEEYGASLVTVLPSRGKAEGLGLVLAEALLAGSAVVGTPAGGIPEVVLDGETGLIARDCDASHLASQLGRVLTDHQLRERLTQAAVPG